MQETTFSTVVMDQNFTEDIFGESGVNEDVALRNANIEGQTSYKCNKCKYISSAKSSLKSHLKINTREKSHKCNQCNYASSHAGHLRTHLKTHSGEKPNKCHQCDFASSDAGNLKKHTGEKSNFASIQAGQLRA